MPKFRKQAEIRKQPLDNPQKWNVVFDKAELAKLKAAALSLDTTAGEIVRVLVSNYLKSLDKTASRKA